MSKQVEVLIRGKQQTEGTLHSLKRQVDALDDLVSSTASDSLFPAQSSSLGPPQDALKVTKPQVMLCSVQELWVGVYHSRMFMTLRGTVGAF